MLLPRRSESQSLRLCNARALALPKNGGPGLEPARPHLIEPNCGESPQAEGRIPMPASTLRVRLLRWAAPTAIAAAIPLAAPAAWAQNAPAAPAAQNNNA